ncbi:MAG: signal peptidase I [Bdellovibrionia bacterium]
MKRTWGEYLATIVVAIGLALLVRTFLITAYKIPTGSMRPTLLPGDFIFVNRLAYSFGSNLERGDLVALSGIQSSPVSYIKRVIGLPGDRIEIKGNILYLNDEAAIYTEVSDEESQNPNPNVFKAYEEKFEFGSHRILISKESGLGDFGPVVVPPGELFLMGDNRDTSEDSRFWGTIPQNLVFGRVSVIWLSLDPQFNAERGRTRLRWERILTEPQ